MLIDCQKFALVFSSFQKVLQKLQILPKFDYKMKIFDILQIFSILNLFLLFPQLKLALYAPGAMQSARVAEF